ncbi:hypothetical protein [Vibrio phage vB_VmeM-Yong XC32]|nr:hypothetical protein [Vibrio phage vB_VmeM-Yong XC31]QAX96437.1 hypothetical protein [Vibrio phage vB_VmeM-Yong XC32]QAX96754.1 hypothetical protein [Vibrio phage vB_VmeM-Yong MS31]QAX97073.1 hypothetical protein [Vibrio phage vB_VmeM-Yong MS32]
MLALISNAFISVRSKVMGIFTLVLDIIEWFTESETGRQILVIFAGLCELLAVGLIILGLVVGVPEMSAIVFYSLFVIECKAAANPQNPKHYSMCIYAGGNKAEEARKAKKVGVVATKTFA